MSKIQVVRAIGFLTTFSVAGAISQPRQSCQFLFCLMKIHYCTGPLGRRAVGRQTKGFLWRRSVELRASGAVGLRWQAAFAPQIVWNRSTRRAGARGGAAGREQSQERQQRDRGKKQNAKTSYDNAGPICNAWCEWCSIYTGTKKGKSNPDDWDRKEPQNNPVESLQVSGNVVVAVCMNQDLEKHNRKGEKRKLGKRNYVHGIRLISESSLSSLSRR